MASTTRFIGRTATSLRSLVRGAARFGEESCGVMEAPCARSSMLRWASGTPSSSVNDKNGDINRAIQFSKARNVFRKSLSEQRKAWFQEVQEKREALAREEARAHQERAKRQQVHLEKLDSDKKRDREAIAAKVERQRKDQKAAKVARRAENVRREDARQAVLASLREERRRQMLAHSEHWIGDEAELDAAIDRAVDSVESLFVSSKVVAREDGRRR